MNLEKHDSGSKMNFGFVHENLSMYERSKFVIVPVPYECTTSYLKGTKNGPKKIIEASYELELYDQEMGSNIALMGIHTLNDIKSIDDPKQMMDKIETTVKKLFDERKFPIMLGGEHTISIGGIAAADKAYDDLSLSLIHI